MLFWKYCPYALHWCITQCTSSIINLKQQMSLFDMSRFQHQKSCFSLCQIGLKICVLFMQSISNLFIMFMITSQEVILKMLLIAHKCHQNDGKCPFHGNLILDVSYARGYWWYKIIPFSDVSSYESGCETLQTPVWWNIDWRERVEFNYCK